MITQLKLDESVKLEFGVSVTGASSTPNARFIIEGKEFGILLPCTPVNENVEVQIPVLKNILPAGEYSARLEVVIDNKIYTPLQEQIVFEPSIEIATKQKPVQSLKESVKVGKVTVKKTQLDENVLRKTQAAMIIAQSLGYTPTNDETPSAIIENAIAAAGELSQEQANTVNDMLELAESVGIKVDAVAVPAYKTIVQTVVEEKKPVKTEDDDELSDEELDSMIDDLEDEDFYNAYDDEDFAVVDDETGKRIEESIDEEVLNEVLSRMERMKARIRMAKNKTKLQNKLRLALHKHSSGATLNHRARKLAIAAMEKKLAKKPLAQLSVAEKERIERIVARRKKAIDRMAMKLVPHVRQVEKDRLSHSGYTQK